MPVKSKSGRIFDLPMLEEESAILLRIAQNQGTYELPDAEFSKNSWSAPRR